MHRRALWGKPKGTPMKNETFETTAPERAEVLIQNGYMPIPIPKGQKAPNISGWPSRDFTPEDFTSDQSLGIRCGDGGVTFFDIDIYDQRVVSEISEEWGARVGGPSLQRTGLAPQTGFLFRCADEIKKKVRTITPTGKAPLNEVTGKPVAEKIEVLARGQQFVAFGIHPDTGQPYRWHGLDPCDTFLGRVADLPEVTEAEIDDFLDWVAECYAPKPPQSLAERAQAAIPESAGVLRGKPENSVIEAYNGSVALVDLLARYGYEHKQGDHWTSPHSTTRSANVQVLGDDRWRSLSGSDAAEGIGGDTKGGIRAGDAFDLFCSFEHGGDQRAAVKAAAAQLGMSNTATLQVDQRTSTFFSAAELDGLDVPIRDWLVDGWIPVGNVSSLYGDGGVGKSLVALQLAIGVASDTGWLGNPVEAGKALFISAEDDRAELHRRTHAAAQGAGVDLANLTGLHLRSLAGEDALLALLAREGVLHATALFAEIERYVEELAPRLVVLDTLADLLPGNENDRSQARQFITLLRGLAIRHECAVMLLAHPSMSGMASGTGAGGNTAWNNSVRARLYLDRVVMNDGGHRFEPDPDARILRNKKNNYGRTGGEIALRWVDGAFQAEASPAGLDAVASNAHAERIFKDLLDLFGKQGRRVNAAPGANYAPKVFAGHPQSEGVTNRAFKAAMERLLIAGEIHAAEEGPPSKRRSFLVLGQRPVGIEVHDTDFTDEPF